MLNTIFVERKLEIFILISLLGQLGTVDSRSQKNIHEALLRLANENIRLVQNSVTYYHADKMSQAALDLQDAFLEIEFDVERRMYQNQNSDDPINSRSGTSCSAVTGMNLPYCAVLDGTNVTSQNAAQTMDTSALDVFTILSNQGKIVNTAECKAKFSSYFCLQGINGCMNGKITKLVPCLSRCVDFQTACQGLSSLTALTVCARTAGVSNTPDDANCFCGDNNLLSGSPYDVCNGPCSPYSECNLVTNSSVGSSCISADGDGLNYCTVLDGVPLTSLEAGQVMDASTQATYEVLAKNKIITNSSDCHQKYANYFCVQGINGCNNNVQTTLVPCFSRCTDYQMACLGKVYGDAAAACTLTAGVANSAQNSNCFCGNTGLTGSIYDYCSGPCHPEVDCGTSVGGLCTVSVNNDLTFCTVLSGVSLSSQVNPLAIETDVLRNYTVLRAAGEIANTNDCKAKYANFFCMQGVYGCVDNQQTTIIACLQRCVDYHTACLGMSTDVATSKCELSAGVTNSAANADCFCANTGLTGEWYDTCTGSCDPLSDCGKDITCTPTVGTGLPFCAVLDGTSFVSETGGQAIDSAKLAEYKTALAGNHPISNSADCKTKYSSFMCTQGVIGCTTTGTTSLQTSLLPCLQRCLDYEQSCLGQTELAAAIACGQSAGSLNTPNNSDCFCGDTNVNGGSWFDQCIGPCDPLSDCGKSIQCTAVVASGLPYCLVLDGVGLVSDYSGGKIDNQTYAAYMSLASVGKVAATDQCKMAYSNFMCPQGVVGCTIKGEYYLRTSLLPCLQRCVEYQVECLQLTSEAAVVVCQASAGVMNTIDNSDCFCGNDSPVGTPYDICVGPCNPLVVCGQSLACTPSMGSGYGFCGVLNGTNLTSLSAGTSQDSSALAAYSSFAATGNVVNNAVCKAAYAAFMCMQGIVGCTAQGTIAVETTLLPCLQRCINYQVACKSLTATAAAAACALTAGVMNTADNADCFCGAGSGKAAMSPLSCNGTCKAPSECIQVRTAASVSINTFKSRKILFIIVMSSVLLAAMDHI